MDPSGLPPGAKKSRGGILKAILVVILLVGAFLGGAYFGGPLLGVGGLAGPQLTDIVVGTNTPFPPFESKNSSTNAVEGIDIDLVNEIGRRNNWNVVWRDFQDWDALLAAIEFRGVDIGASSITSSGTVGAERNNSFDFSNSYYEADQAVVIRTGTTTVQCAAAECTASELANHTVAVQTLTSSYWWVQGELVDTAMTPASMVTDLGDLNLVIAELVNGNVEWILVDKPIAQALVQQNTNLAVEGTLETNELYAFAVANNDPQNLIAKINTALAAMRTDGTLTDIMNKWLG